MGGVMTRWVRICAELTSGLVCRPPRQRHVCVCARVCARARGTARPIMAEEAKKLAAYAAVDNHVQVGAARLLMECVHALYQRPPRLSADL